MASKTKICNMALTRLGVTKYLNNVETDRGKEATTLNLHFDEEVKAVLRAFPWPMATKYAALALVSGSSTVRASNDWQYAYRYPSDCAFARRIVTHLGRADRNPPPYRVGRDAQGKLVYTDQYQAELEYTTEVIDAEELDPLFVSAVAWKLAAATSLALSRVKGMLDIANQGLAFDLSLAKAAALNEGQVDLAGRESDMIADRA